MSFTDIKTNNQGFTIVELLIVVVVIAILAAITIVSYNGITNRANASSADASAASFQKKLEIYAADNTTGQTYPTTLSALTASGNTWTVSANTWTTGSTVNGAVSASTPASLIQYIVCGRTNTAATAPTLITDITSVTGARIARWNYATPTAAVEYTDMGLGLAAAGGTSTALIGATTYNTRCFAPII